MPPKKHQSPEKRRALARERMQVSREIIQSVTMGNFHQGSDLLSSENRGSQCTCMSLIALIRAQETSPEDWTSIEIDSILFTGDQLYSSCRRGNPFIMINELPSVVCDNNQNYGIKYESSFCGTIGRTVTEGPFYSLQNALQSGEAVSSNMFVLIGSENHSYACAVVKMEGGYFVFDSHSRSDRGLSTADGTAVLVKVKCIDSLYTYMRRLIRSLGLEDRHHFEIVPCKIERKPVEELNFYSSVDDYLRNQEEQRKYSRKAEELPKMQSKSFNESSKKKCYQRKWLSKVGVTEARYKRETAQRLQPHVQEARKAQRKLHDLQESVKQARQKREVTQRAQPDVKQARMTQRKDHDSQESMKQARQKREATQRAQPDVKQARKTQRKDHDSQESMKQARQKREATQRAEPDVFAARKTQRKEHDLQESVKQTRQKREATQRAQPGVKEARKTQRKVHDLQESVKQARQKREATRRAQPGVKEARKTQRKVHDLQESVKQARQKREATQRAQPGVKEARKTQRKVHDLQESVKQARQKREATHRTQPDVKEARKKQRKDHDLQESVKQARQKREGTQRTQPDVQEARKKQRKEHDVQESVLDRRKAYRSSERVKAEEKQSRETKRAEEKEKQKDIDYIVKQFKLKVLETPKYICCSCERFRFRNQVQKYNKDKYKRDASIIRDCGIDCMTGEEPWICLVCHKWLKNRKIPPMSMNGNNLKAMEMPEDLQNLNTLEQFLVTPVIPFMKVICLPKGQQKGMHGPVVCVASDINKTLTHLPRTLDDSGLIKVKLKRKLEYRGHHLYQQARPNVVAKALNYLKQLHPAVKGKFE